MTVNDINEILKSNFQAQLQEGQSLPANLAEGYKEWVRSLMDAARQKMMVQMNQGAEQQGQEEQQGATSEQVAMQQ